MTPFEILFGRAPTLPNYLESFKATGPDGITRDFQKNWSTEKNNPEKNNPQKYLKNPTWIFPFQLGFFPQKLLRLYIAEHVPGKQCVQNF
jgi:hypothetical protein